MSDLSVADRYLNLAMINIGEALTELGNIRQRGAVPGADCANVKLALGRALAALDGRMFEPAVDLKHVDYKQVAAKTTLQPLTGVLAGGEAVEGFHGGVTVLDATSIANAAEQQTQSA